MNYIASIILFSFAFMHTIIANGQEKYLESIHQNTKPIGSICFQGESKCSSATSQSNAKSNSKVRSGKSIYQQYCSGCHASGVAGAPKFGNKSAWKAVLRKGKSAVYKNAITGKNAMPPRGLCNDCSDKDIQRTVDYLIKTAQ